MYMTDGLHLSGKGAAVFADGRTAAVDSGMGSITNNKKLAGNIKKLQQEFLCLCKE